MPHKLTKALVIEWLNGVSGEFHLNSVLDGQIFPEARGHLRKIMFDLVQDGRVRASGKRDGWYRKVDYVEPIKWWDGEEAKPISLIWPYGIEDMSSFGFDDTIEICEGDSIVIAGVSNMGKSAFVHNLLVNNIDLFEGNRLLVNEYNPSRFRDRMNRMTWGNIWDGDKPKFELLPVTTNHEDYIKSGYMNYVDWVLLSSDFWVIAQIIQSMQMRLKGKGVVVIVLQKTKSKEFGTGGDWGQFLPAVYLTIDPPGKLTVIKVKSAPMGQRKPEGKIFAFDIVDRGTKFHNIREVKTCPKCRGTGFIFHKECDTCFKKGYVDK